LKIVVTGGEGFVGRFIVNQLVLEGHDVASVDIATEAEEFRTDVTDGYQVHKVLSKVKPDVVIHLAGLCGATGKGGGAESLRNPYDYLRVNVSGALNIFEACRELGINQVLCMSSFSTYGRATCPVNEETPLQPRNPYGSSKVCVEEIAKCYSVAYKIKTLIFRPPLICGERQKEMNALREFVSCALQRTPIVILGNGEHVREFVHPQDVAKAFSAGITYLSKMKKPYDIFVLGSQPVRMKELAELVIMKVGRGSIELSPETNQVFDQFTDHSKAKNVLGWVPAIGIDELVSRVIDDVKYSASTKIPVSA